MTISFQDKFQSKVAFAASAEIRSSDTQQVIAEVRVPTTLRLIASVQSDASAVPTRALSTMPR